MDAESVYQFLKPSLEGLSQKEKEELCRLICGAPKFVKEKNSMSDREKRIAEKKRRILKTGLFKN